FKQICPGNIFTTTGIRNAVVFETGSSFILSHANALNPFGQPEPDTKVIFRRGSNFEIRAAAPNALSLSGRNYSNLFVKNNSSITVNENFLHALNTDDITVENGSSLVIKNLNANNVSQINLNGNLNIDGYFCLADTSGNRNLDLIFSGTTQSITGNGIILL